MFKITNKQILALDVKRLDILAPAIVQKIQTGQFVSVCPQEADERIPLTVIEADKERGIISLIVQEVGYTTTKLGALPINASVFSILGPLGRPATIEHNGTVVCIAVGIGTAQLLPICRGLRKAGNKVIGIIGAKTKKMLMLEAQMRLACQKIFITTNDGSYERKGLATDVLKEFIARQEAGLIYAIGSVDMMQTVRMLTHPKKIKTLVYVNPTMVDCMGMCGSCRIRVGGKVILACLEGPEFDGHEVDFDFLQIRMNAFKESGEWFSRKWQHKIETKESETSRKFLWDLLKK